MNTNRLIGMWVLLIVVISVAGGCQRSISVGAVNRCGVAIEVRGSDGPLDVSSTQWIALDSGESGAVVGLPEAATRLFIAVVTGDQPEERRFEMQISNLELSQTEDLDVEVVFGGPDCSPTEEL